MEDLPNIARVLLNLSLNRSFDYRIPEHLRGQVRAGMRVNVPFGRGDGERQAYVVAVGSASDRDDLKEVLSICTEHPALTESLLKIGEWMADYYCCARELAVRTLLPGAVRSGKIKAKTKAYYFLNDMQKAADYINKNTRAKGKCAILKALMLHPGIEAETLAAESGASKAVLNELVKLELVSIEDRAVERNPFAGTELLRTKPLTPTGEQAEALNLIYKRMEHPDSADPHVILLHGVTGSGKTEVYLQAIARAVENGKEAIVLVPEISLTPQTVERFRARFGDMVSVLHSGLTDGERYDEWMKVHRGKVRIAVGARSALFAPFRNLALIIVDEEHDSSYKQSEAPRYNARDVAVMRGKLENALVILGSATPSMESYYNAKTGKYTLCKLTRRSDPSILMPEVKIIDMRLEGTEEGKLPFLSKFLVQAVRERIARGEQSIIFLNRRGYARQMACDLCGYVAMCPDCSVAYTYHRKTQMLTCHLCASSVEAPSVCPNCGSEHIRYSGAGTERIENISLEVFKNARIARMDSDSMTRPSLYAKVLSQFRRGELDILIGTQMIAKGLHFPNVTLVGIVNADMGLFMPDFRAAERSFQLLTQVAGRAGRGEVKGEVLVQTCSPFNPPIMFAAEHDYEGFYQEEIAVREELKYPPFGHMMIVHFRGEDPAEIMAAATALMEKIQPCIDPETIVSEPAPAPIERVKGKYRYMATFRYGRLAPLRRVLRREIYSVRHPAVEIYVDVDAISML